MKFSADDPARPSDAPIFSSERRDRPRPLGPALLLALACPVALAAGCQTAPRQEPAPQADAISKQPAAKATPAPEVQIYEDEAMLRGSQAVLAGTVHNLSDSKLENLKLELELRRRGDEATETRMVEVKPKVLAPGEKGRYSVSVSREWGRARVLRLSSDGRSDEIAYVSARGALRPPERIPDKKVVGEPVPRPRPKGEEFLNTPETADKYP